MLTKKISRCFTKIGETRIFKDFTNVTNNRVLHSIKDLEPIVKGIQKEAEKYQNYCDEIVDSIQNLKVHLMLMKNELLEQDTTKRILTFANNMVQSYVKHSVKESLNELIESWEQYSCVLPLPYIDQEIASFLPDFIYKIRQDLRKKFHLEEENVIS
jgi:DNA-binding FrmR family transcriptional regulator